jgi:hypothetical protein
LELYQNIISFLKLLSLFTENTPKLTYLDFLLQNEITVEQITIKGKKDDDENNSLLDYDTLEPYWGKAMGLFYQQRDKFSKVLDLLIESNSNRTAEISFLNITTALELFHKNFMEKGNSYIRDEIFKQLKQAGLIKKDIISWDQIMRYQHLFHLTTNIQFFSNNISNPIKFIETLKDSRNYYTHYSLTKKQIWSPNKLLYINRLLRQLVKAVILKQLEIPEELINKLLNNRADIIYLDYENNDYSVNFKPSTLS